MTLSHRSRLFLQLLPTFIFSLVFIACLPVEPLFLPGAESSLLDSGYFGFHPTGLGLLRQGHLLLGLLALLGLAFALLPVFGFDIARAAGTLSLSSGWLFLLGHTLTFDLLLACYHTGLFLILLIAWKKPGNLWWLLALVLALGSLLIDDVGTTLFLSILFLGTTRLREKGKVIPLFGWGLLLVCLAGVAYRWVHPSTYETVVGFQAGNYLLFYGLLLMLTWPLLGFLPAVLKDSLGKWKRADPWSMWLLSAFFGGLVAQSPVSWLAFALLVCRHMVDFDAAEYPFRPLVRYWSAFIWVVSFFLFLFLLTFGHFFQSAGGFRAAFQAGFGIWLAGLLSLAGMYGNWPLLRKVGLLGGNAWVGVGFLYIILPLVHSESLLFQLWDRTTKQKSGWELVKLSQGEIPPGVKYVIQSANSQFSKTTPLILEKSEQPAWDSIQGLAPDFRQRTWYLGQTKAAMKR